VASLSPRILLVEEFLSEEECQGLMDLAKPRLIDSKVSVGEP
jgi:hypothetical protein